MGFDGRLCDGGCGWRYDGVVPGWDEGDENSCRQSLIFNDNVLTNAVVYHMLF